MSKRTLLLADDSVTIQKVVNLTFADEGIDVITVGDGDSAMEKISQVAPDVVLADVHMPGLSGYQICEIVRENPMTKDLPVVLLVGSFEPFDESEAARVGANAYLTKPFQSIRQLVTQVTDLMQASAPAPEPEIPQAEPEADETAPVEQRVPDTTDIESLYNQSFTDPSTAETDASATRYVDAGMDDEMIEANVVGSRDDAAPDAPEPAYSDQQDYGSGASHEQAMSESGYDHGFAAAHAQEVSEPEQGYAGAHAQETSQPSYGEGHTAGYAQETSEPSYEEGHTAGYTQEPNEPSFDPHADYSPQPAGDTEAFESFAEDRHEAASAAAPALSEPTNEFDEFSRTEQIEFEQLQQAAARSNSEESEILELPPIENDKTVEFTTTQRSMVEGQVKQVVDLSPEQMDAIVQKVVEKLSEKY